MRIIALALLALVLGFARPADAQTCAPAEVAGAKGDPIRIGSKGGGVYAFTFCRDDYSVRALYLYAPWSELTSEAINSIQTARSSVTAFSAEWSKVTGRQCEIERGSLTVDTAAFDTHWALCSALYESMMAVWPADPVWRVVPLLSGDGSRPMYPVVNGVRSTSAVKTPRAPASAKCGCTVRTAILSGANRWCPLPGLDQSLVTLCARQQ